MSNPDALSVDDIERRQRQESVSPSTASTGGTASTSTMPPLPATATVAEDLESLQIAPKTSKNEATASTSYAAAARAKAVEPPKLISPAVLAQTTPKDLRGQLVTVNKFKSLCVCVCVLFSAVFHHEHTQSYTNEGFLIAYNLKHPKKKLKMLMTPTTGLSH